MNRRRGRSGAEGASARAAAPSLYGWIWRHSRRAQIAILLLILASMPFYFLALDLPRHIVNGPIQGNGFTEGAGQLFRLPGFLAVFPFDALWPREGFTLGRWPALLLLSLALLVLIIINGGFKYAINVAKGRLGERMLRRLRFALFERVLALTPQQARGMRSAEIASMINNEAEPLGGFVGEAIVTPVFLGGQAITAAIFILTQNVWLGLVALATVGVQGLIIPRLRRRLLMLGRERQLASRRMGARIAETVEGLGEVSVNQAEDFERADLSHRLARIYAIRFEIYQRKFLIKFLNNSLAQVPPLLFFLLGGWLVLAGRLDIGQLLAVLVAYKDLPGPIKDLIDWDHARQDAELKFEQVMEGFNPPALNARGRVEARPGEAGGRAQVDVAGLGLEGPGVPEPLKEAQFTLHAGDRVAVLGAGKGGASAAAQALAGLARPSAGLIRHSLPAGAAGAPRIAFAGEDPFLARGSLRAALLYGLRRTPGTDPSPDLETRRQAQEAALAGTPWWPETSAFLDVARLGTDDPAEIDARLAGMLAIVGFENRLLALALEKDSPETGPASLPEALLAARRRFRARLGEGGLDRLVAPFEPEAYNAEATIEDNLVFGHVRARRAGAADRTSIAIRLAVAVVPRLVERILGVGIGMARAAVDLYGDLPPDDRFVLRQRLVPPEQLPALREILARLDAEEATEADRDALMRLALTYCEPIHRLGLMKSGLAARIVAARQRLRDRHEAVRTEGEIDFLDPDRYSSALTIEENVVFGVIVQSRADGPRQIRAAIRVALEEAGALAAVLARGLDHDIGNGGRALTLGERQQVALARALLRKPDLLVADRALGALPPAEQRAAITRIHAHLDRESPETMWFFVAADPGVANLFSRRLTFRDGVLERDETGTEQAESARTGSMPA